MKVSKNALLKYNSILSKRDKAVLRSLKICRFLKTDQVRRLHFRGSTTQSAGLRSATRILTKLHKYGLIQPLKRRIGGVRAGSASFVWTLREAGHELLRINENNPTLSTRKQVFEPTFIFLKHTLAISELYTRLSAKNLIKAVFEPDCWRNYSTAFGVNATLKPDLYAVTASDKFEDHWFFEVDLDTEAPSRILRKCESYGRYYITGDIQKDLGVFPRVVWIVPDEKRKETLRRYISEGLSEYTDLFTVIVFDELDSLINDNKETL